MKYYRPAQELTGKRLSASTLASFMAGQSVDDPDQIRAGLNMSAGLLRFLLRDRAISYWSTNGWLKADPFNDHFVLTTEGIRKVQDRLAGRAKAQSVTSKAVQQELQIIKGLLRSEPLVAFELLNLASADESHRATGESQRDETDNDETLEVDKRILAAIWTRRGQPDFRRCLLAAYGSRCAVTRCEVEDALEAAHITPFSEEQTYGLTNGILLRSDIHTLFDLFLLSVEPRSWTVRIAPQLTGSYGDVDGSRFSLPTEASARPDEGRLLRHYREWQRRWSDSSR